MGSGEGLFHISRCHLAVSVRGKKAGKEGERHTPKSRLGRVHSAP